MKLHTCLWPGCELRVLSIVWGCEPHWSKLPKFLRDKILATYSGGQEMRSDMDPPRTHLDIEVDEWIEQNIEAMLWVCDVCGGTSWCENEGEGADYCNGHQCNRNKSHARPARYVAEVVK